MTVPERIYAIRTNAKLSQEQFADMLGVSRQSVQKWENGSSLPELEKIIKIAKLFSVTVDSIVLDSDLRLTEELNHTKKVRPEYSNLHVWENYSSDLMVEYRQSIDEGLNISRYKEIFETVSHLPAGEIKKKFADVLYEVVLNAPTIEGYPYIEPSDLPSIRALRKKGARPLPVDKAMLPEKIRGAWMGRICGCLLGKPIECVRTNELIPFLKQSGNYPMHRYILSSDVNDDVCSAYKFRFAGKCYADTVDGMPPDDDTTYTVLAQKVIDTYGKSFEPKDVAVTWLRSQHKNAYCTAERVAYCNFIKGFEPPQSAMYKNPYREYIGAQIRGDYFGYINPGKPEDAAEMAFRDACISHVKNGIYGEMWVAAMLAGAATTDNIEQIIEIGLGEIPHTSRLYKAIHTVLDGYRKGVSQKACFQSIHNTFDEHSGYCWCHTISNAMIVTAALLYGGGDYGKSICMAVEVGFDTDCNGATVGSVIGMARGVSCIGDEWTAPIGDTLHTEMFESQMSITDCINKTLAHIKEDVR